MLSKTKNAWIIDIPFPTPGFWSCFDGFLPTYLFTRHLFNLKPDLWRHIATPVLLKKLSLIPPMLSLHFLELSSTWGICLFIDSVHSPRIPNAYADYLRPFCQYLSLPWVIIVPDQVLHQFGFTQWPKDKFAWSRYPNSLSLF